MRADDTDQAFDNGDSDAGLIAATRAGDSSAFAALWLRHEANARRFAASVTRRFAPDDLVSEAFVRVLRAIRAGHGPEGELGPYLRVSIRNIAVSWARRPKEENLDEEWDAAYDAGLDRELISETDAIIMERAMQSLPPRWREVLWLTEAEGMPPSAIAARIGVQANSVAALSYRARRALRAAWIQQHVRVGALAGEHRWAMERVGKALAGTLAATARRRLDQHLYACRPCRIEIDEVSRLVTHHALSSSS